jgi:hypothetical protein
VARGPLRGALRLPALQRDAIVGHRTSLRHPTPLKTTPSMSEAADKINAVCRGGDKLFFTAYPTSNIVTLLVRAEPPALFCEPRKRRWIRARGASARCRKPASSTISMFVN